MTYGFCITSQTSASRWTFATTTQASGAIAPTEHGHHAADFEVAPRTNAGADWTTHRLNRAAVMRDRVLARGGTTKSAQFVTDERLATALLEAAHWAAATARGRSQSTAIALRLQAFHLCRAAEELLAQMDDAIPATPPTEVLPEFLLALYY